MMTNKKLNEEEEEEDEEEVTKGQSYGDPIVSVGFQW